MSNVRDALDALNNGQSVKFRETIESELMGRLADAFQEKKIEVGRNFFNQGDEDEDV